MNLIFPGRVRPDVSLRVTLAACASAGRPTFADEGRTVVAVENQREVPMDVFIADAGRSTQHLAYASEGVTFVTHSTASLRT